jgi:hypothetical protein
MGKIKTTYNTRKAYIIYCYLYAVYNIKTENKKAPHSFPCNVPIVMRFLAVDVNNINNNAYVQ